MGLRDEPLRITHTAMNFVINDVTKSIKDCFRGDRRIGNDQKFSSRCVLTDENAMTAFMMGFPKVKAILREVPTMFAANIFNQYSTTHYLDVAQEYGLPGDVCPMPEAETGICIDDDLCILGCCAVQVNTACDGSLMGDGNAKRLERDAKIPLSAGGANAPRREDDVQTYASEDIKKAIAFVEEHTGQKWDWDAYFSCAKRVNDATRRRLAQLKGQPLLSSVFRRRLLTIQ
ncbi:MAG: 2-hydroxyacyl-CoA dehydratase family protein [Oscillospiraceae bacterium]